MSQFRQTLNIFCRIIFLPVLGFMVGSLAYAGPLVVDLAEVDGEMLGRKMLIYEDKAGTLSLDEIARLPESAFETPKREVPIYGSSSSIFWARMDLDNRLEKDVRIFLEYTYNLVDYVDLYLTHDEVVLQQTVQGDKVLKQKDRLLSRTPVLDMMVPPGKSQIFIKVQNRGYIQFPVKLWSESGYYNNNLLEIAFLSAIFFLIAMMFVYNLFIYIQTRESSLLPYLGFISLFWTFTVAQAGFFMFFPNGVTSFLTNEGMIAATAGSVTFLNIFLLRFLEIRSKTDWRMRTTSFFIVACISTILVSLVDYTLGAKITPILFSLNSIAILVVAISSAIKGNRNALFFTISWVPPLLGSLLKSMYWKGIWFSSPYMVFADLVGSALEVVLISLAIGYKMRVQIQTTLQENQRINLELVEKEHARTTFFHNTSHELRTPLNGMIGFLNLLIKGHYGPLSSAVNLQLQKTLRLADSLKNQVNTILDLARMRRGEVELNGTNVSLSSLKSDLDGLAEGLSLRYARAVYSSELTLDKEPDSITQDYEKLFTIGRNLLGNAFKFADSSRPNSIHLEIRRYAEGMELSVSDQGIGIPDNQREKIFEEFSQVQDDARRAYEGTGLGLSMVREFVHLMGGTIELTSQLGEGSKFVVRVPELKVPVLSAAPAQLLVSRLDTQESIAQAPVARSIQVKETLPKDQTLGSILVVDDNEINCEVIQEILEAENYQVSVAHGGRQALGMLNQKSFDMVLLDVMMPEVSGEDVLNSIRSNPSLKHLLVILVTARASEEDRIYGLNLGADDYVSKPIIADELILRVRNMLTRIDDAKEMASQESDQRMQQLGELFSFVSHEIKNVYHGIYGETQIEVQDLNKLLLPITLSPDAQAELQRALASGQLNSRMQMVMDALPRVARDQNALRLLKTEIATLDLTPDQALCIWKDIESLPTDQQNFMAYLLSILSRYRRISDAMTRSQSVFFAALEFVHSSPPQHCLVYDTLAPVFSLLGLRARKQGISITTDIGRIQLAVSPIWVQQILMNLVTNAIDAVAPRKSEERKIEVWTEERPDQSIAIHVRNAGQSIPADVRAHLFERGFTTKGSKGNGLGLYFSRKLAHRMKADLFMDDKDELTCFVLVFDRSVVINTGKGITKIAS
jgi:signal transduction histidine kinase